MPTPVCRTAAALVLLALTVAGLAACSSGKSTPAKPTAVQTSTVGVTVGGAFGSTPTITVPTTPAPTALTQQVLSAGQGAPIVKDDTIIANYVGQTWAPKSGKVNVFDSSFSRGAPAAFLIGEGQVIAGWDTALIGKSLGSRLLLTVPPADGYGTAGQSGANISGTDTLVFVIDLIAVYKPDASAPGTAVAQLPTTGFPKIINTAGQAPAILSTAGVTAPTAPVSTLLVTGSGAKIDSSKQLVMQLVETDIATATDTHSSWGQAPQTDSAASVLGIADKLTGQNVGSRALVLLPATPAVPATATADAEPAVAAQVLIVDVVGQF